jgi:cytochrome c-type biogenesis protein CcmH/NrfG
VLLDQKRTKRMVQVVSVLTAIAFCGIGVLVIGIIFFGNTSSTSGAGQLVKDARALVDKSPRDADAWAQLAGAYDSDAKPGEAVKAAAQAVKLEPNDFSRVQQLVGLQQRAGLTDDAVTALQAYTQRKPQDADGFLLLGRFSQDAGKNVLARLAYQRFLALDPENLNAPTVRQQLKALTSSPQVTSTP